MASIAMIILIITLAIAFPAPSYAQEGGDGGVVSENNQVGDPSNETSETPDVSGVGNSDLTSDYFSGAAIQRVDFPLPAGRGGLTPKVYITYNSHNRGQDSVVGMGWQLSLNYIAANFSRGMANPSDRDFVIFENGNFTQLVPIRELSDKCYLYGYKVETESARQFINCGSEWRVMDKAGRTYIYGSNAGTVLKDAETEIVYQWYLHKVMDINKNEIHFRYDEREWTQPITDNGDSIKSTEILLDSIRYTYHPDYHHALYRVKFHYDSRNSIDIQFNQGVPTSIGALLRRIEVSNSDGEISTFHFEHISYLDDIHYLTSTHQSTPSGELPARRFDYSRPYPDTEVNSISGIQQIYMDPIQSYMDIEERYIGEELDENPIFRHRGKVGFINKLRYICKHRINSRGSHNFSDGDPCTDSSFFEIRDHRAERDKPYARYPSTRTNLNWIYAYHPYWIGDEIHGMDDDIYNEKMPHSLHDMNGDGFIDKVLRNKNYGYKVYLNTGFEFSDDAIMTWAGLCRSSDPSDTISYICDAPTELLDVNGDGLVDQVSAGKIKDSHTNEWIKAFSIGINNSISFKTIERWSDPFCDDEIESQYPGHCEEILFQDFTGDGIADRYAEHGDEYIVFPSTGMRITRTKKVFKNYLAGYRDALGKGAKRLQDMNGDGLVDQVWMATGVTVHYNRGTHFHPVASNHYQFSNDMGRYFYPDLIDMNGDGLPDLLIQGVQRSLGYIMFNTGFGFSDKRVDINQFTSVRLN